MSYETTKNTGKEGRDKYVGFGGVETILGDTWIHVIIHLSKPIDH